MTGCYPRRVNLHEDHRGGWVLFPRGNKGLNPDEVTIAEVLSEAGITVDDTVHDDDDDTPPSGARRDSVLDEDDVEKLAEYIYK